MDKKDIGAFGERMAGEWMKQNGYAIIERNYRCRAGEIDIIACRGGVLVFAEVKTRTGDAFGMPAEAVDRRKQQHMRRAAQWYMNAHRIHDTTVRFDVVEILIDHLKGVAEC
ncbi:MAG: YraN family protein [Firmicutes bacterium]|nr:YraN family protein [Bacillota bacterium]MBQ3964558.1 YraN family protein [Bacillota bacterium]